MCLDEDMRTLREYLESRVVKDRFTGTVTLTLHCNDGGIGRIKANVDHDLKKRNGKNLDKSIDSGR